MIKNSLACFRNLAYVNLIINENTYIAPVFHYLESIEDKVAESQKLGVNFKLETTYEDWYYDGS